MDTDSKAKKNFFILLVFLALIIIAFNSREEKVVNAPSNPQNTTPQIAEKEVPKPPAPDPLAWRYSFSTDEMSGEVSKHATKKSLNTVNFDFPYHGVQRGTIMLLDDGVLFYVEKGQVICQGASEYGKCHVRVKFDDEKDKYVIARKSGDDSTTIYFGPSFLKSVKKGKKLMIQTEVFQNGHPIFTFDLTGYNQEF